MHDDLVLLLGKHLDDILESSIVRSLQEQPQIELIEDRIHAEMPRSGVEFIASMDGTIMTIQLHAGGFQGYAEYSGSLPGGVSFSDSRSDAFARLGEPSVSGDCDEIPLFGATPAWDRFDRESHSLHLQYSGEQESIVLVTLMRPDVVPR